MMARLASIARDERAASAAEFAMVLPLLLLFLFGIIDVGRYMWTLNRLEKATQMGVRYAVVSDPVANVINTDFVGGYGLPGGNVVPNATFGSATCDSTGNCTVTGAASSVSGRNATAFTAIVTWMQRFYPLITAPQVRVIYQNVGLGYAGDPTGPDVSPLTTVEVRNMTFQPLILFGGSVTLPTIRASLTLEDGECSTTGDCGFSN
ncbi:pilus assembly protein [Sphingomonas sp. RB56-2]|uniref:Pilus assembly protein n=1 Tax=Sphingomonas brevis TaxID=2908206 RepID=A0ABT0SAH9_9SPHN|nr:TadE/TadG family type IV pilus assembly protein [Sphingomonas brevis]MCL6741409.1 pilus assembly protein [Sphingomonas brevis]